jgi:hypothetical protein
MKPKKSIYCQGAKRFKMKFETEKAAETFIKFNSEEIKEETGYAPIRAYYCRWCIGWHTSSSKYSGVYENDKRFDVVTTNKVEAAKETVKSDSQEVLNIKKDISELTLKGKQEYFDRRISQLKLIINHTNNKSARKELEALYSERAKAGLRPIKEVKDPFSGYKEWFDVTKEK